MRAIVLAYHDIGCTGIEALLEHGFEIAGVLTRTPTTRDENVVVPLGRRARGPPRPAGVRAGGREPSAVG